MGREARNVTEVVCCLGVPLSFEGAMEQFVDSVGPVGSPGAGFRASSGSFLFPSRCQPFAMPLKGLGKS